MMIYILLIPILFVKIINCQYFGQPEQVHISYGGDPSCMYVTWVTQNMTKESIVNYGQTLLNYTESGVESKFIDGGHEKRTIYIHRVTLRNLIPGRTYIYRVGSQVGWSVLYYFRALKKGNNGYRFAVFGDLGNENGKSLSRLQMEAQNADYDMIIHNGDFAYDMNNHDGKVGDQFMRQIEPIAAYVPYMVTVGNHENAYNFSHYTNRFTMPSTTANLLYSFDLGDAHFIALSSEFYFFTNYGWDQIKNQYEWLTADLKAANLNRDKVPWIITMAHRPMYCSNTDGDDCTHFESIMRTGLPGTHAYALEDLFYEMGVDLCIFSHEHSYERLWPVYNRTVYNGTVQPYTNPPAPVHVITGSAGCKELTDRFVRTPSPWSAFRSFDYGYGRMNIYNKTHLYWEEISDDKNGQVIDNFWLIKHEHKPYILDTTLGTYIPY